MNLLIDTHYLIWLLVDLDKISENVLQLLADENNTIYYSPVSLWEISIKFQLNKLDLDGYNPDQFYQLIQKMPLTPLPLENHLVASFYKLPTEHKDPFDRLLIWQCIQNDLLFISTDGNNPLYEKYGLNYTH